MRIRPAAIFAALIALTALAFAQSLTFPVLSGRVVDEASLLDAPLEASLTQTSADLEAKTTDQLVVVTLKSLQGTSIEDYGYRLGRHWQIGQKDKNNGVLLIVAPNERKVRIEVGYGLEGTLTDAISNFIIQNSILPRFKAGDFPGGIKRGAEDIVQVLSGDAEEYKQRAVRAASGHALTAEQVALMIFLFFFVTFILVSIMNAGRRGARRRSGDWWDNISVGTSSGGGGWSSGGSSGGGFSGGGGSFGGGGSSGSW